MSHDTVREDEYKGFKIRIVYDPNPSNPRKDFDNLGKMVCFHRNYDLGDKHDIEEGMSYDEFVKVLEEEYQAIHIMPLFLLDHSSLHMKTTRFDCDCGGWDTSLVGAIYTTEERMNLFGAKEEYVDDILEEEVEIYSNYINGECYGWQIFDRKGEEIDACWGYFEIDYAIECAKDSAHIFNKHENEEFMAIKTPMELFKFCAEHS